MQGVPWLLEESAGHPQERKDFPDAHVISPVWDRDPCDLVEDVTELRVWVRCIVPHRNNIAKYQTQSLAKMLVI